VRIVSGKYRGRQIRPPSGLPVRPTTDFAKENLFNILNNYLDMEGLTVLDLFAGTGSISFEFISRGAGKIVAVDSHPKCHAFIQETGKRLNAGNLSAVRMDVFRFLKSLPGTFDLVFADPPYDLDAIGTLPALVLESGLLRPGGWFILEHSGEYDFSGITGFFQRRKYGSVNFSFFVKE
jgi:16S rRNA (guanine966-N2)-methyltransferase